MRLISLAVLLSMPLFLSPQAAFGSDNLGGDRVSGASWASRSSAVGKNGMVATAHPLASIIGLDVLKSGGNAVDAAIAANAALGLMEPTGCGIGGDLFAIIWDPKTNRLYGLDASGAAPMGQSLDALKARLSERGMETIPSFSALSVSVPGTVSGWAAMHDRFGSADWASLFAPSIQYAREGFPLTKTIAHYWGLNERRLQRAFDEGELEEFANAKATFFSQGPLGEGSLFHNRDLADTYETLAQDGAAAFYEGRLAQTMAAYMDRIGGPLRQDDFARHQARWIEPVSTTYRGYQLWELPPQGQGIAALQILAMLENFDLASLPFGSAQSLHLQIEAKRLAFEDRAKFYADPSFASVPTEALLSGAYSSARASLIDPSRAMETPGPGDPALLEDGDTTYLTVADKDGMMVSLIQSNYRGMGSGLVPDGLGFMLQNRGEMFALDPGHANVYAPGKRPFHTIIPAFITRDGQPIGSFGLMGGGMQPQGHAQILINILDYGMNIQEAGDAARWRHDGSSEPTGEPANAKGIVHLESGFGAATRAELEAMGHTVRPGDGGFGGYQMIWRDPQSGVYLGASEMRKDGTAIGY
jgi:gamma-glutamyltranspeptidase / glutathione hydrolase